VVAKNELTAPEALARLTDAVREAGEIGLRYVEHGARTFTKKDASPVTEADLAIDAHLALRLKDASPDIGWLSEEAVDSADRLARRQVWIVDPIDGTRGFVAGNGEWVISAALVEEGRPIAGVLLRPTTGDLYQATRGGGARKNGALLRASDGPLAAIRCASGPKAFIDALHRQVPGVERGPSLSSLALRLAFLAEGRFDVAFAKKSAHDWDVAAAELILQEAGGRVTWIGGEELVYNRPDPVHSALVAAGRSRQQSLAALVARVEVR
jgi:myo-inositol-1(or 4)-monophosphatase